MADSSRETALEALRTAPAGSTAGADGVKRNAAVPQRLPPGGMILFDDGDPGEPDEMMSPPQDAWAHEVELTLYVQEHDDRARTTALDALAQSVGAVLGADRTLGGAVDFLDFGPLVPNHNAVEGAATVAAGTIRVTLYYETPAGGLA